MGDSRDIRAFLRRVFPVGASLPDDVWQRRHRALLILVGLHIPFLAAYGWLQGSPGAHLLGEVGLVGVAGVLACLPQLSRNSRMLTAALAFLIASGAAMHLPGGPVEMDVHFLAIVAVITLYQSWVPCLLAGALLVTPYGLVGLVGWVNAPAVSGPGASLAWASLRAVLIAGEGVACLSVWKFNEAATQRAAQAVQAEELTAQFLAITRAHTVALEHQALHDALTGLPNRTLLNERLREAVLMGGLDFRPSSLLLMDLDNFKEVNDTLGHAAGDLLLQQFGRRLRGMLRESDTVARLGGDEFAIMLGDSHTEAAETVAVSILARLREPFTVEEHVIEVSASIGIASYPQQADTADAVLRRADVAMYLAKQSKVGFAIYRSKHDDHSRARLTLMTELRRGIESNQLRLLYQPLVDLKGQVTYGLEALLRWEHPVHGLMAPKDFVIQAEQTDLMEHLTAWVLAEALAQTRLIENQGAMLSVSVNLSGQSLKDPGLPASLAQMIWEAGLTPERLTLELLERRVVEQGADQALRQLRDLGVYLSIDDFGTGFSSLSYLKHLPVTGVKIDQSFVTHMATQPDDSTIVRPIIDLAHNLQLNVVAEGVEDEPTLSMLKELDCDYAQGFHIGRPMCASALLSWLSRSPWPPRPAPGPPSRSAARNPVPPRSAAPPALTPNRHR